MTESAGDNSNGEARKRGVNLALSERFINWAKGLSILAGGLIAMYGAFLRGEPDAKLAYERLATELIALREELHTTKAYTQGFLDGQLHKQPSVLAKAAEADGDGITDDGAESVQAAAPWEDAGVSKPAAPVKPQDAGVSVPTQRSRDAAATSNPPPRTKARAKAKASASALASASAGGKHAADQRALVKKYMLEHYHGWSPQQRATAVVLAGRAIRERWSYTHFLLKLTSVLSNTRRAPLPKTLDDAKRQEQQEQMIVKPPNMLKGS